MPLPIYLSHRIAERLSQVRKNGELSYLRPDGKTQVTIGYEGNVPRTVETVVVSTQHDPQEDESLDSLRRDVLESVVHPVLSEAGIDYSNTRFMINPMGKFEIGGPKGDAGLTGRKIIVDTYGGASRHVTTFEVTANCIKLIDYPLLAGSNYGCRLSCEKWTKQLSPKCVG
jgi:S-adenosylmethionine synthetase